MDINTILQAISGVGFPIVMCLILANYVKTTQDKLIDSLQALTLAVQKLETRMDEQEEKNNGS